MTCVAFHADPVIVPSSVSQSEIKKHLIWIPSRQTNDLHRRADAAAK